MSVQISVSIPNAGAAQERTLGYVSVLPESLDKILELSYLQNINSASTALEVVPRVNKQIYLNSFVPDLADNPTKRESISSGYPAFGFAQKAALIEGGSFTVDLSGLTATVPTATGGFNPLGVVGRSDVDGVADADVGVRFGVFGTDPQVKFEDNTTVKVFDVPVLPLPSVSGPSGLTAFAWGRGLGVSEYFTGASVVNIYLLGGRRANSIELIPSSLLSSTTITGTIELTSASFLGPVDGPLFTDGQYSFSTTIMEQLPSYIPVSTGLVDPRLTPDLFHVIQVAPNARCQIIVQPNGLVTEPTVIDNVLNLPRNATLVDSSPFAVYVDKADVADPYPDPLQLGRYKLGFSSDRLDLRAFYPATEDTLVLLEEDFRYLGYSQQRSLEIVKPACLGVQTYSNNALPVFDFEPALPNPFQGPLLVNQRYSKVTGYGLPVNGVVPETLVGEFGNIVDELGDGDSGLDPWRFRWFANEYSGYGHEIYILKSSIVVDGGEGEESTPYCAGGGGERDLSTDFAVSGVIAGKQFTLESVFGPLVDGSVINPGIPLRVVFLPSDPSITGFTFDLTQTVLGPVNDFTVTVVDSTFAPIFSATSGDIELGGITGRTFINDPNPIIQLASFTSTGSIDNLILNYIPAGDVCVLGGTLTGVSSGGGGGDFDGTDHDEVECSLDKLNCCGCDNAVLDVPVFIPEDEPALSTLLRGVNGTRVLNEFNTTMTALLGTLVDAEEGIGRMRTLDLNGQQVKNVADPLSPTDALNVRSLESLL